MPESANEFETQPDAESDVSDSRGFRQRHRWLIATGVVTIALVSVAALCAYSLTRGVPPWWRQVRKDDHATAEAVEHGVINQLSHVRPTDKEFTPREGQSWQSEEWSVSIKASDANAWLNARLPRWLANREPPVKWPDEISELQVEFDDGRIWIGARLTKGDRQQVLAASLRPELREDGSLWIPADGLELGALPIPQSWVLDRIRDARGELFPESVSELPEARDMFDAFAGKKAIVTEAIVRLEGGRRVRLLKFAARNGRLDMTFRTEKR